jgi:hypothetical protein
LRLQRDRALRDPEVLGTVGHDPALLAIIDALECTQPLERRWSLPLKPLLASALVAAAAPWQSNTGLVPRTLAATGQQPVVHVVSAQTLHGLSTLDLRSGRMTTASSRVEVYFDAARKLERIVTRSPLGGISDELHTANGDWVNGTSVWTCARSAAHPAAAARARVSCPVGASTRPQPPSLDPALAEFAAGYQAALAGGNARHAGDGKLNGRPVHWLAIGSSERVAVDSTTLLPVLISRTERGQTTSYRVLTFETVPFATGSFTRAKAPANPPAGGQSVHGSRPVTLAEARTALGGALLVPASVPGLRFESARVVNLLTGYNHKRPALHSVAVELSYRYNGSPLMLHESRGPDMIAGFTEGVSPQADEAIVRYARGFGQLSKLERQRLADSLLGLSPWRGLMKAGGLYITVNSWSKPLLLQVSQALAKATR